MPDTASKITALTAPHSNSPFDLAGGNAPPAKPFAIFITDAPATPPVQLGNLGLLNVAGDFLHFEFGTTNADGKAFVIGATGDVPSGFHAYAQFFTLVGTLDAWASSKGLDIVAQ